jgi:hypothetical protein
MGRIELMVWYIGHSQICPGPISSAAKGVHTRHAVQPLPACGSVPLSTSYFQCRFKARRQYTEGKCNSASAHQAATCDNSEQQWHATPGLVLQAGCARSLRDDLADHFRHPWPEIRSGSLVGGQQGLSDRPDARRLGLKSQRSGDRKDLMSGPTGDLGGLGAGPPKARPEAPEPTSGPARSFSSASALFPGENHYSPLLVRLERRARTEQVRHLSRWPRWTRRPFPATGTNGKLAKHSWTCCHASLLHLVVAFFDNLAAALREKHTCAVLLPTSFGFLQLV